MLAARALGVLGARRVAKLPDVSTLAEEGINGVDAASWHALFAPAGTPHKIVELIQRAVVKALNMPNVRDNFLARGQVLVGSTPEKFEAEFKSDLEKFAKIVKDARIPLLN